MTDLVLAFAVVGTLSFGAVWCLFGSLDWLRQRVAQRHASLSPAWLDRIRGQR